MKTFEARNYDSELIENLDKLYGTSRQKGIRIATSAFKKMESKNTSEEKRLVLRDAVSEVKDPYLMQSILNSVSNKFSDKRLGITGADKGLKNKSSIVRAEYIMKRVEEMSPELVGQYINIMQQRKILTPSVVKLIGELRVIKEQSR